MPLDFALRPRLRLDRPAPARRPRRFRVPPLAVPVAAYWLAMAGLTKAVIASTAEESETTREPTSLSTRTAELVDAPSEPAPPELPPPDPVQPAVAPPPPAPFVALAPPAAIAPPAALAPRAAIAPPAALAPPAAPLAAIAPRIAIAPTVPPPPRTRPFAPVARAEPPAVLPPEFRAPEPATALPSCESVAATANQSVDLRAARGAPDLTRDAFASVLENGAYLARCAPPARTALEICAAVQDGKAIGVSVASEPRDPALNACVRRAVAALRFPSSARLDVTRTRFEAAR